MDPVVISITNQYDRDRLIENDDGSSYWEHASGSFPQSFEVLVASRTQNRSTGFPKRAVAGGGPFITSHGVFRETRQPGIITMIRDRPKEKERWSFGFTAGSNPARLEDVDVDILANRAIAKIRRKSFDLGTNLGEAGESIRMIGNTAKTLAKAFSQLKRGNVVGAAKELGVVATNQAKRHRINSNSSKSIASGWLALQYGWLPLLGMVKDAAEALAKAHTNQQGVKNRFKVVSNKNQTAVGTESQLMNSPEIRGSINVRMKRRTSAGFLVTSTLTPMQELMGSLQLDNPLEVAWELLPLSFVADWFIPIGNYVSTFGAVRQGVVANGWISRHTTCDTFWHANACEDWIVSGTGSQSWSSYQREPRNSDAHFGGLSFIDDVPKTLSSIALLHQKFHK